MATGFLVGGIIGGINSALDGRSFWKGAAIGAASGAVSGFAVDLAVATGGIGGIVIAVVGGAVAGGGGNFADQTLIEGKTLDEVDWKDVCVEATVGGAANLLSFGVSGGSLEKATGKVWDNIKKNAVDTLMEGTTKTVSQNAVNKTTKVISTSAGKAVVRKTIIPTVVKKVAQNSAVQLANTTIISSAGALATKSIKPMLM